MSSAELPELQAWAAAFPNPWSIMPVGCVGPFGWWCCWVVFGYSVWYLWPRVKCPASLGCTVLEVECGQTQLGWDVLGQEQILNRREKEMQAEVVVSASLLLAMLRANSFPTGKAPLWGTWDLFLCGTAVIWSLSSEHPSAFQSTTDYGKWSFINCRELLLLLIVIHFQIAADKGSG